MRFPKSFLFLLAIAIAVPVFTNAQDVVIKRSTVVERYKDVPFYIHFVSQGETLDAIAKAYQVSVEEITAENGIPDNSIKADMVLRIPQKSAVKDGYEASKKTVPVEKNVASDKVTNPEKKAEAKPKTVETQPQTTSPAVKPTPSVKKEEVPQTKPQAKQGEDFIMYKIKKKDTFYSLSKQFKVSVEAIQNANPGMQGLKEDEEIKIPNKNTSTTPVKEMTSPKKEAKLTEITVKQGETLYSISKLYNVSIAKLNELNPELSNGLKAGMVLKLSAPSGNEEIKKTPKPENEKKTIIEPSKQTKRNHCYNADNIAKTYQVGLLLPFLLDNATAALEATDQKDPSTLDNFNYFQFYEGFMLAADSLEKMGLKAKIHVLDADKLNDSTCIKQALNKPIMKNMNLLVGPIYASSFAIASRFAKQNRIGIVNPLTHRENIVSDNPYVIKAQVSDSGVAMKLSSFIELHYPNANVVVVRNDKKEMKAMADDFAKRMKESLGSHRFKGGVQETVFTVEQIAGVTKKLKANTKNVVIFFSNNKSNVPNLVSLLNPSAKTNDILLVGMDGWDDMEIETEFLVNLNYHQVNSSYIDYESDAAKQFFLSFKNKYGAVPVVSKHAYLGFDLGWYFLTSLMWYGEDYIACIPGYDVKGLQFHFAFGIPAHGYGLQNQDVNIVKLDKYKMVKVD